MSWSIWLFGIVWFWNLEYVPTWLFGFFGFEFGYFGFVMSWSIWFFGFVWFWNLEYVDLFGFGIWNIYVVIWICNFLVLNLVIWICKIRFGFGYMVICFYLCVLDL
jgi:hypothetical protein